MNDRTSHRGLNAVFAFAFVFVLATSATLALAEQTRKAASTAAPVESAHQDAVDRDYIEELPRTAPTEPNDALATIQVEPGFRVELAAAEPLVVDPVAIEFDEKGWLWVVEMRGYSEDGDDRLGRVRVLKDTDGDGRIDDSTVFADGRGVSHQPGRTMADRSDAAPCEGTCFRADRRRWSGGWVLHECDRRDDLHG